MNICVIIRYNLLQAAMWFFKNIYQTTIWFRKKPLKFFGKITLRLVISCDEYGHVSNGQKKANLFIIIEKKLKTT